MSPAQPVLLECVLDADSHEMTPAHFWGPLFGTASGEIAARIEESLKMQRGNDFYAPGLTADSMEITQETVWSKKGTSAPGAFDFKRRLEVMDHMGISRQLVFPSYAIFASMLMVDNEHTIRNFLGLTGTAGEIHELGKAGLDEYSNWAAATTALYPDRMRCVAYIMADGTVEDLVEQGKNSKQVMYAQVAPLGEKRRGEVLRQERGTAASGVVASHAVAAVPEPRERGASGHALADRPPIVRSA
jgi:hypothetical protein